MVEGLGQRLGAHRPDAASSDYDDLVVVEQTHELGSCVLAGTTGMARWMKLPSASIARCGRAALVTRIDEVRLGLRFRHMAVYAVWKSLAA